MFDDVGRLEAEHFADGFFDCFVADLPRAKRVDADADGIRVTNGVGKLNLGAGGEPDRVRARAVAAGARVRGGRRCS